VLFDMLVSPTESESEFRALSATRQAERVLNDWKAHDAVAENETADFVWRAQRVRSANYIAARDYSPDRYPGSIDVFRAAGSQSSDVDSWAVALNRVDIEATDDESLGRQLTSRITAEVHP
jgi:hypothetical protein